LREDRGAAKGVFRERVVLAGLVRPGDTRTVEPPLTELRRLAETAGAEVVDEVLQKASRVSAATFVGKGKAAEIGKRAASFGAGAVLFNNDLSPAQVRNLEKVVGRRVVDRSEVILDIFALRARSREAKVQVELAQYEYLRSRLKRMWTHLERMEAGAGGALGGIGTRGPGEKQLEVDRRLVARKVGDLKQELELLERQTRTRSKSRRSYFRVSLVGYTNAGKSSLLRAMTGADAFVEDRLFATLDTQTRAWTLPGNRRVFLSDTVGFLRDLPHHLVASFRATLAETLDADLLLHVVDASHPDAEIQRAAVDRVLEEIEASTIPRVLVLNKADAVRDRIVLEVLRRGEREAVVVSALSGEGLPALEAVVLRAVERGHEDWDLRVDVGDGRTLAWLAARGRILEEEYGDAEVRLRVRMARSDREKLVPNGDGLVKVIDR
jgi:GTP-binding protein HflX